MPSVASREPLDLSGDGRYVTAPVPTREPFPVAAAVEPEPEPEPDVTPPVVSNYSPTPGGTITATTALGFDVTEEGGTFCKIMVTVFFAATGDWEVVHTGDQFSPRYIAGSSRVPIADGFSYTVRRTSGWPSAPTIFTYAIDAAGNEST